MRPANLQPLLLVASTVLASPADREASADSPTLVYEAASLVSAYVPLPVYAQLTASVAAAASAASVTGDPGSLFLSAILATTPPAWFCSAVPPYFSSNINALEAAVSNLRSAASLPASTPISQPSTSASQTLVVTRTTNSLGGTITTSYTSTLPKPTSRTSSGSGNAAAPTAGAQHRAGLGIAALAAGLAAIF